MAVKVSPHEHAASDRVTDTDRYLSAGAAEASIVRELRTPEGRNIVIESTSVLDVLIPDLFVFVADAANEEWKESALRVAGRADYVVNEFVTRECSAESANCYRRPRAAVRRTHANRDRHGRSRLNGLGTRALI